jgi:hypothetical protein
MPQDATGCHRVPQAAKLFGPEPNKSIALGTFWQKSYGPRHDFQPQAKILKQKTSISEKQIKFNEGKYWRLSYQWKLLKSQELHNLDIHKHDAPESRNQIMQILKKKKTFRMFVKIVWR